MERIQDFFKELGTRIKNPFYISFFISWLIANYKIFVGLFFYSIEELRFDGYSSYFEMIKGESSWSTSLYIPLIAAIGYTVLTPLIKWLVSWFYLWIGQKQELSESKLLGTSILGRKYLRTQERLKEYEKKLTKTLDEEGEFLSARDKLQSELHEEKTFHLKLKSEYLDLESESFRYKEQLTSLQNDLKSKLEQLEVLKEENNELSDRFRDFRSHNEELYEETRNLKEKIQKLEDEVTRNKREISSLMEKNQSLKIYQDVKFLEGKWSGTIVLDNRKDLIVDFTFDIDASKINYNISGAGIYSITEDIVNIIRYGNIIYIKTNGNKKGHVGIPDPFTSYMEITIVSYMEIDVRGLDNESYIRLNRVG